ncbi:MULTISPECIES: hypothetical protein [unclassified Oceanobacter]|uniref:hypothetical protein n=1 Tax=unclassified Oceanobacter TaxID=2620260 RepID=UPI00273269AE|nr:MULTISPECIES: hypothetical protein [unclassified Oceanobacter]MDP2610017.1 hypothetical protein [Oceanobacter sp. 1_MG-2023]MDP2613347.1 hypothetical protein [Oceanobacter sp. 2_MG-2023]
MIVVSNSLPTVQLAAPPLIVSLVHNLPADVSDYFVLHWLNRSFVERQLVVRGSELLFSLDGITQGRVYKLVAYGVDNGLVDGVWWHDNYVYDPGQATISFTSGGNQGGSGETKTFTGSVRIESVGVARQVVAVALDADPVYLLASTTSDLSGSYTLEWQGYSGQMLVTALDDYGVDFETGKTLGEGDRVHPPAPNGYVYVSGNLGTLGPEPLWPTQEGASVTSGNVQLVAVPFWRPKSAGPFSV